MTKLRNYILCFLSCMLQAAPPKELPKQMLWAWEARQDLQSINPKTTGIALLILTIDFEKSQITYYPRQQPLYMPKNTYVTAVVHINNPPKSLALSSSVIEFWALKIKNEFLKGNYKELQIDFDATTSLHEFYSQLLTKLRQELGDKTVISITALASWCTNDRWLNQAVLPIDYVVPMFFSLDNNKQRLNRFIQHFDSQKLATYCQGPIGLTTGKDWEVPMTTPGTIFIYNKGSWNQGALHKAQALQRKHHIKD